MAITALYFVGLALILVGERILGDTEAMRLSISGTGAGLLAGATVARALSWFRARGERRGVEGWLLFAMKLGGAGILIYAASTSEVMDLFKLDFEDSAARTRYVDALTVVWPILLAASVIGLVFAELAYTPMRQAKMLEARRVRASAAVGVEIAVVAAALSVLGFVSRQRDIKVDMSYFKTSAPTQSTRNIVDSVDEPVKLVAFFPDVNEVSEEVRRYGSELAASSRLEFSTKDRFASPKLAEEYRVRKDGTLVLARGDKSEAISIGTDLDRARTKLRRLDTEVQKALLKLVRDRRTLYMTTGHGEIGDIQGPESGREKRSTELFKKLLEFLNYRVKKLGLAEMEAGEIPDDAAAVIVLSPAEPLLPEEQAALGRYLDGGGRLLVALDPDSGGIGDLAQRLGVKFTPTALANDKVFARRRYNSSDHQIIITNRFSSHASVTTLSRHSQEEPTLFLASGSLEKADGNVKNGPKVDFVVRSLPSTFADQNGNFLYDKETEKRATYNLVAAISKKLDPAAASKKKSDGEKSDEKDKGAADSEMRALVFADADALGDAALRMLGNRWLAADAVKWLAGEEEFAGEVESTEEDMTIEHTRKEDQIWFWLTIAAMPAVVLGGGLAYSHSRRRRGRAKS